MELKRESKEIKHLNYFISTYRGEVVNDKPDGMGKQSFLGSKYYEGQWTNGLKNGHGKLT